MECILCQNEADEYLTGDFIGYEVQILQSAGKMGFNLMKSVPVNFCVCFHCLKKHHFKPFIRKMDKSYMDKPFKIQSGIIYKCKNLAMIKAVDRKFGLQDNSAKTKIYETRTIDFVTADFFNEAMAKGKISDLTIYGELWKCKPDIE